MPGIELRISCSDIMLNYWLFQKLKLLENGEFNHLIISPTGLSKSSKFNFGGNQLDEHANIDNYLWVLLLSFLFLICLIFVLSFLFSFFFIVAF